MKYYPVMVENMMKSIRLLAAAVLLLFTGSVAFAQNEELKKFTVEELTEIMKGSFLSIDCNIPYIQPFLCNLTSSVTTNESELVRVFFSDERAVTGKESVKNALWGRGMRYKSGQKIVVGPKDMPLQQAITEYGAEVELVPAFLDVFSMGFAYRNNIAHRPVYAAERLPSTLERDESVKFNYVYSWEEGLQAAESLINEMFGQIDVPEGFQSSVDAYVNTTEERLFHYKAVPQFKTRYNIYGQSENQDGVIVPIATGEAQVAVPVYDRYVSVVLDGDKVLVGMDYFWDNGIRTVGQPQECITANQAMLIAREELIRGYNERPPLITVREIRLAYVEDRSNPTLLIPVWMCDAAYARPATPQEMLSNEIIKYAENKILVPIPFAVNALTSEFFLL